MELLARRREAKGEDDALGHFDRSAGAPRARDTMTSDAKAKAPTIEVSGLRVELSGTGADIIDEVVLHLRPGEILGLVGESGSGKTTVGLSLLGHTRHGARIVAGRVTIAGHDMTTVSGDALQNLRGRLVAYIPQDPPTALNPSLRIGDQLEEPLRIHASESTAEERDGRVREILDQVLLPSADEFLERYPHQLSGGQQQRVMIAMAFVCRPSLIVCDEPTTGLDVTTQARVLELLRNLCRAHEVAALYVTHDLAVVSSIADRMAVMYSGRIVETGTRDQIFENPRHPYTRGLLLAVPDLEGRRSPVGISGHTAAPGHRPKGCFFAPRCPLVIEECHQSFPNTAEVEPGHTVRCYRSSDVEMAATAPVQKRQEYRKLGSILEVRCVTAQYGATRVLDDVSLTIDDKECLALVGESGSGKTTLARCIAGLHRPLSGSILLHGVELASSPRRRSQEARREIQYIFQNPYASLNPRQTVNRSIKSLLHLFFGLSGSEANQRVRNLLERVLLPPTVATHYPEQLSGGERQRVAIARALAANPSVLVCDEITSSLDVSVQAGILDLLTELRQEMNLSLLFITHNLALIRTIADRVAVLSGGHLLEVGATDRIFEAPEARYTKELLANTPNLQLHDRVLHRETTVS
jgi:peptide/nickel transport system ATP-binding protein